MVTVLLAVVCFLAVLLGAGTAVLNYNSALAAQSAEPLRRVIGDQNVATIETWLLAWQDTLRRVTFTAEGDQPQAPFASATPAPTAVALANTATPASPAPTRARAVIATQPAPTPAPPTAMPARPTSAAPANQPRPLAPLGQVAGEGVWSVFMNNPVGQPVGFRTFLAPDPKRN
jgi:ABC-type uncharacterized transport system involved in gliding motility auxiliary subunit